MALRKAHIFHHNDLDGKFAAFYMYQYLKKYERYYRKTEFYEIDYNQEIDLDPIYDCDLIIFVDYSFSNPRNFDALVRAYKAGKKIIWIDHHKSSIDALTKLNRSPYGEDNHDNLDTYFDDVFSATRLVYYWCLSRINKKDGEADLFANAELPALVQYVDAYDLWHHDRVYKCEEFHYGIQSERYTPKRLYIDIFGDANNKYNIFDMEDRTMLDIIGAYIENKIKIGEIIKKSKETDYEYSCNSSAFEIAIEDRITKNHVHLNGIAMNIHGNSSAFLDLYNKYDFVCPFYLMKDGKWKYSFYSHRDDVTLNYYASELAKSTEFGGVSGGGHKSAAGLITTNLILHPGCIIEFKLGAFTKKVKITVI